MGSTAPVDSTPGTPIPMVSRLATALRELAVAAVPAAGDALTRAGQEGDAGVLLAAIRRHAGWSSLRPLGERLVHHAIMRPVLLSAADPRDVYDLISTPEDSPLTALLPGLWLQSAPARGPALAVEARHVGVETDLLPLYQMIAGVLVAAPTLLGFAPSKVRMTRTASGRRFHIRPGARSGDGPSPDDLRAALRQTAAQLAAHDGTAVLETRPGADRFRDLFDNANDIIYTLDLTGRFTFINPAAERIFGYPVSRLLTMSLSDLLDPESLTYSRSMLGSKLAQGGTTRYELTILARDGRPVPIEVNSRLLYRDGRPVGVQGIARDVSERHHAQAAQRLNEERFRLIADATRDAIWDVDLRTGAVWRNETYNRTYAPPPDSVVATSPWWEDGIHPEDRDLTVSSLKEAIREGRNHWQAEYRFRLPHGGYAYIDDRAFIGFDDRGEPVRIVGAMSDITVRKTSERTLRDNLSFLATLVNAIPNPLFYLDADGVVLGCNSAFADFLDLPVEGVTGRSWTELDTERLAPICAEGDPAIGPGAPDVREVTLDSGNSVPIHLMVYRTLLSTRGDGRHGVLGVLVDVTAIRHAERTQKAIAEIAASAASAAGLLEMLANVHISLKRLMAVPNFFVALYDAASGIYRFPYWFDEHDTNFADQALPDSLTDYVRTTGRPQFVDRRKHAELEAEGRLTVRGHRSHVWMGVPLRVSDRVVGVVGVQSYRAAVNLQPRDLEILSIVSDNLAQAIERKQAEVALRESERFNRQVMTNSPQTIYVFHVLEERNVFLNRRAFESLDYDPEFMAGSPFLELLHPDDRDHVQGELRHLLTGLDDDETVEYRYRLRARTGEYRWFHDVVTVFSRDADGRVESILGFGNDVTEAIAAQEALAASEKRHRTLVESAPYGVVVHRNGRIEYANPAAMRIVRATSLESLMGRQVLDLLHPDYHDSVAERIHAIARGESVPAQEERLLRLDGTVFDAEVKGVAVRDEDGVATQVLFQDITERKQAERALAEAKEQFEALVQAINGILWQVDDVDTFRFSFVSRQAETILGYPVAQWLEPDFWVNHLHPEDRAWAPQSCASLSRQGRNHELEYRMIAADGRVVWVRDLVSVQSDRGRPTLLRGVILDITERKEAEAERLRWEEKLRHAAKLESLGVLAGGIAHDFNNLLTGIMGNAGLAMMELPGGAPAVRCIENIEKASQRAAELCKQMLAYSGRGRFVVEHIHLNTIIRDMVELLNVSISKKINIRYLLADDLPALEGDAAQIGQVIMNLITNASDAIGETEGVITLETGVRTVDRDFLHQTFIETDLPDSDYLFCRVSDTGCGMDAETRERLFDPFFTTKFTGRGLGLAAVLGIVRGHHGAIHITSAPGQGSTFEVIFPIADGGVDAVQGDPDAIPARDHGGTILVVDDEQAVRDITRDILHHSGYTVITAEDGIDALEKYDHERARIDLVVLDMTMPRLGGVETFHELKRRNPAVRVLMTSGYTEQDAARALGGENQAEFIQKPFTPSVLLRRIREILEG